MSAAKHTPGPWSVVVDGTCSAAWPFIVPDGGDTDDAIAELDTTHLEKRAARGFPGSYAEKPSRFEPTESHDEVMANARLIAAAPELLDALQAEQEWREREANGATDPEWDYERMVGDKRRAAIAKATGSAA